MNKIERNHWRVIGAGLLLLISAAASGQVREASEQYLTQTLVVDSVSFDSNIVVLSGERYELPPPSSAHPQLRNGEVEVSAREFYEAWIEPGTQVMAVFAGERANGRGRNLIRLELPK
jgi:hypothetical protein